MAPSKRRLPFRRVLQIGSDEFDSERLQRLRPRGNSSVGMADSNVLMLGSRHAGLVLVAWMAVMPPNKGGSVADVEAVAANIDPAIALEQMQGPRQSNTG